MKGLQIPERFTGTVYIYANSDPESFLYEMIGASHIGPMENDNRIIVGQVKVEV